jgi:hypothetical protein
MPSGCSADPATAAVHSATQCRRDLPQVIPPSVRFPLNTTELVRVGIGPELLASLALQLPDPQFPVKTPAGHRLSMPVPNSTPGGQPIPRLPVRSPGEHLHPLLRPSGTRHVGSGGNSA